MNTDELIAFIRERRSNETYFDALWAKTQEYGGGILPNFDDVTAKAEAYRQAKEAGGTAWPEFEKFVTALEKATLKREQ